MQPTNNSPINNSKTPAVGASDTTRSPARGADTRVVAQAHRSLPTTTLSSAGASELRVTSQSSIPRELQTVMSSYFSHLIGSRKDTEPTKQLFDLLALQQI